MPSLTRKDRTYLVDGYVAVENFSVGDGNANGIFPACRMTYAGSQVSTSDQRTYAENYGKCLAALSILLDIPIHILADGIHPDQRL